MAWRVTNHDVAFWLALDDGFFLKKYFLVDYIAISSLCGVAALVIGLQILVLEDQSMKIEIGFHYSALLIATILLA